MKTAAQFFAEYFECSESEAKGCHDMTLECMEAFAKYACREQRKICSDAYKSCGVSKFDPDTEDQIKNAPQPKGV